MAKRTCAHCGKPLPPDAHHRRKYCDRTCERANYKVPTVCSWCGETFLKDRYAATRWGGYYCSDRCKGDAYSERSRRSRLPVVHPHPDPCTRLPDQHPARRPAPRRTDWWQFIVNGPCQRCGETFTALVTRIDTARYCSTRCLSADAHDRRRARKAAAYIAPVFRRRIFERDSWRCQLCKRKVDPTKEVPHPRAPTIDHVVPLAAGGTHEPANVQTACFLCNATKGDRGTDQLRLIG